MCDLLDFPIYMPTLIRDSVVIDRIYHSYFVIFLGIKLGHIL